MDYMRQLGALVIASRLKRLTDRLIREGEKVYRAQHIAFEPRWFPVFSLLAHKQEPQPITDIARSLGLTHPAVINITGSMIKNGVLESLKDERDARKHLVSLTNKGLELLPLLEPLWANFEGAVQELFEEVGYDVIDVVEKIEQALDSKEISARILELIKRQQYDAVEILEYRPEFRHHFKTLNHEWLKKYFSVEELDERILENPKDEILQKGGLIFFARLDSEIVGTAALLKLDDTTFEITKMAVTAKAQGRQVGKKLSHAIIDRAKSIGAATLFLHTDKKLAAAVALYRKLGFTTTKSDSLRAGSLGRARFGFTMKLDLSNENTNK